MIKNENEVTLLVNADQEYFVNCLLNKGFSIVNRFTMDDCYLAKKKDIEKYGHRELLNRCLIVRLFDDEKRGLSCKVVKKVKEFDEDGNILAQSAVSMAVNDYLEAINFFDSLSYDVLMRLKESDIVLIKDGLEIIVKDIEDGPLAIEVETCEEYPSINSLIKELKDLALPLDYSNYFFKKAEFFLAKKA